MKFTQLNYKQKCSETVPIWTFLILRKDLILVNNISARAEISDISMSGCGAVWKFKKYVKQPHLEPPQNVPKNPNIKVF